jgi:LPXTG-motif cell wall-anchored protein
VTDEHLESGVDSVNMTKKAAMRLLAATAVAGVVSLGSVGAASATPDPDTPTESYPIPTDPVTHPPQEAKPLPRTGGDGTDMWLKIGGGALLAGGVLVAATTRRRSAGAEAGAES